MCAIDRGVSRAEPRADVEGGCSAAADDDVVCMGVVLAPIDVAAGSTPVLCILAFGTRQDRCTRLILYVFRRTRHPFCIIHRIT